jgi:type IV pilus assembly protein PilM
VRRKLVGLDIGHTHVRAVGISAGSTPTISAIGSAPVAPGVVNEGEVLDSISAAEAIKKAWSKTRLGRDVVLGVSGRHVIVRQVELPWLEEKAFRKALPYRVASQLPVPVEDVVLDYIVVGDGPSKDGSGGRVLTVLLVAAMREPVLRAVRAVEKAGLRPHRIDLGGLALLRAPRLGPTAPGVAEARVDIGAEVTTVVVQVDGVPRFVRMLAGEGGLKLSTALVDRLDVSLPEAEELKSRLGTSSADPGSDTLSAQEQAARNVIDRVTDSTLSAVRSSLDFFLTNTTDVEGLGSVFLTGGGALLPGLVERFATAVDIPVRLVDPLEGFKMSRKAADVAAELPSSSLAVAAGLSLGKVA